MHHSFQTILLAFIAAAMPANTLAAPSEHLDGRAAWKKANEYKKSNWYVYNTLFPRILEYIITNFVFYIAPEKLITGIIVLGYRRSQWIALLIQSTSHMAMVLLGVDILVLIVTEKIWVCRIISKTVAKCSFLENVWIWTIITLTGVSTVLGLSIDLDDLAHHKGLFLVPAPFLYAIFRHFSLGTSGSRSLQGQGRAGLGRRAEGS